MEKDYSLNNYKLTDIILPIKGFTNYVKRNTEGNVIDSNNYANGFWHLLGMHVCEIGMIGVGLAKGIEALIN